MEEEEAELRNPFPSPPSHYTNYTTHNLDLLKLLKERVDDGDLSQVNQHEVLSDQTDVPDWPLTQLEKPRVDWIREEGAWTVFGDTWPIEERHATLAELGMTQLYPSDPNIDRRPALLTVLKSMLVTYSHMLNGLLAPPPTTTSSTLPEEWRRHTEWIGTMSLNLTAAANELRPVQARGNLELMMRRQLGLRREETQSIHAKCDELEAKLSQLSGSALEASKGYDDAEEGSTSNEAMQVEGLAGATPTTAFATVEDVLRWAEEIG